MATQNPYRSPCALCAALAVLVLIAWSAPCRAAAERVLSFESRVTVHRDGSLFVVETVRVKSLGLRLAQGLVREFPTSTANRFGQDVPMRIQVRNVLLDGADEPYRIEETPQGVRMVTGREGTPLPEGEHTFVISYEVFRHITYRRDYDELEWPVTGNGWPLIIDRAECVVELPVLAFIKDLGATTGSEGAQGQDYDVSYDAAGNPVFTTTRRIYPGDGLVIRVAWPKGLVAQPDIVERTLDSLRDHLFLYLAAALLAALALRLRRKPLMADAPLPEPDAGPGGPLSPALARMALGLGQDRAVTLAALAALTARSALTPRPEAAPPVLAPGPAQPGDRWHPDPRFAAWPGLAAFGRRLAARGEPLAPARDARTLALVERPLLRATAGDLALRALDRLRLRPDISLPGPAALVCLGLAAHNALAGLAITLMLSLLTLAAPLLLARFFASWRAVLADAPASLSPALAWTALAAPAMAAWIVAAWFFFQDWPLPASALLILSLGLGVWLPWNRAKKSVLHGHAAEAQLAALRSELQADVPPALKPFALALARDPAPQADWVRLLAESPHKSAPA